MRPNPSTTFGVSIRCGLSLLNLKCIRKETLEEIKRSLGDKKGFDVIRRIPPNCSLIVFWFTKVNGRDLQVLFKRTVRRLRPIVVYYCDMTQNYLFEVWLDNLKLTREELSFIDKRFCKIIKKFVRGLYPKIIFSNAAPSCAHVEELLSVRLPITWQFIVSFFKGLKFFEGMAS